MKRMTSNEYNPCFNCNFYSSCSHIRENFPVCPERARYDRLAAIEDILGDEYDLDELKEVVQAKREGRCVVLPKDGMVYYIEEAGGEKWIGNKPIQQVILRCGFGMALLEFSLFDKGKYFSRAEAEEALRREQDEQIKP